MDSPRDQGLASAVQASVKARAGDRGGQAARGLAPKDAGEHPPSSWSPAMTDYADQADRYLILIEGGPPSNYSAWSPDLPGCVATGESLEEVEAQMREAIAFHLEGMAEDGESLPEPSGPGVYVELVAA